MYFSRQWMKTDYDKVHVKTDSRILSNLININTEKCPCCDGLLLRVSLQRSFGVNASSFFIEEVWKFKHPCLEVGWCSRPLDDAESLENLRVNFVVLGQAHVILHCTCCVIHASKSIHSYILEPLLSVIS